MSAFSLLVLDAPCTERYARCGERTGVSHPLLLDYLTRWAPPKENNTEAYIRRVTDRIGIGPDKELGDPQTHPTQWMMIGIAMAIVENGTTNLDYLSMLKGYEMANSQ